MSTPANSINETTTGITGFTGTSFTGTAVTEDAVITGGATSSTLKSTGVTINATDNLIVPNNTYIQGRNAADSADVDMFKIDTADQIDTGSTLVTRSLFPISDSFYNLGTTGARYLNGYFDDVTITNDLAVSEGGTGRSSHTAYAVICGGTTTTAAQQSIASVGTSGQVLTSNGAGALPTFQNASGGGLTWNAVSGTTQTAAVNNGYICLNNALTTITLPTTASVGDVVRVTGTGTAYFKVDYGTSVLIHFVDTNTDTTITTGSLTATDRYASLELLCVVADLRWNVISATGNFTVA